MSKNAPLAIDRVVKFLATEFVQEFGFGALATLLQRLSRPQLTVSQRVSIARALRPFVAAEARRRQGHGKTAPGRRRSAARRDQTLPPLNTAHFIAKCVGFAPATLRKAERVMELAEADPRLRHRAEQLDDKPPVAKVYFWATERLPSAFCSSVSKDNDPAFGTDFGAAVLEEMASTLLGDYKMCTKRRKSAKARRR